MKSLLKHTLLFYYKGTGTCLQLFANWRPLTRCKLSCLIWQQFFLFCKQTSQSLQYFKGKPTDGISCVPVPLLGRGLYPKTRPRCIIMILSGLKKSYIFHSRSLLDEVVRRQLLPRLHRLRVVEAYVSTASTDSIKPTSYSHWWRQKKILGIAYIIPLNVFKTIDERLFDG